MAGLDAGGLDRRIRIERATTAEDDLGTDVETWSLLQSAWAKKLTQRATEAWKAGGTAAQREVVWQVRYTAALASMIDIGSKDRIVFGDQVYPVSGVVEIGRREGLEITTNPSGQSA